MSDIRQMPSGIDYSTAQLFLAWDLAHEAILRHEYDDDQQYLKDVVNAYIKISNAIYSKEPIKD